MRVVKHMTGRSETLVTRSACGRHVSSWEGRVTSAHRLFSDLIIIHNHAPAITEHRATASPTATDSPPHHPEIPPRRANRSPRCTDVICHPLSPSRQPHPSGSPPPQPHHHHHNDHRAPSPSLPPAADSIIPPVTTAARCILPCGARHQEHPPQHHEDIPPLPPFRLQVQVSHPVTPSHTEYR